MLRGNLTNWLDEFFVPGIVWYAKRLSGNDTLANGSHQAGPYIPKSLLFSVLPDLYRPEVRNPEVFLDLHIDSHDDSRQVRGIWYNNKLHGGTRNEARLTRFGGSSSVLLDPDSTGSLVVFAFRLDGHDKATDCRVWVCRGEKEEHLVEDRIGPVEPGKWVVWSLDCPALSGFAEETVAPACWLKPDEIPQEWLQVFPSGKDIVEKAMELRPDVSGSPDKRLLKRRDCEYNVFRSLEEAVELPDIRRGFETMDEFLRRAQSILQRRKARSGYSLELHAYRIFTEEGLRENHDFVHQPESEPGRRPDFLFPSAEAYRDTAFPETRLRMLATKTTCKDRWRQILNEANRISRKHLLTLQEGVSERQYSEMREAGVQLVVPSPLVQKFPSAIRSELQTFASFIDEVRVLDRTG